MKIECPVSLGELVDKLTILEIKKRKISNSDKRKWAEEEFNLLQKVLKQTGLEKSVGDLRERLEEINENLWEIEDNIREKERQKCFDKEFVELARSVYLTNDERFKLKSKINEDFGSVIRETKSYQDY